MYNTQNSDLVYIVDVGAKNLLNVPNGSYTTVSSSNPTTFSVINGEMTVTTCTTNDTRQVEVASITLEAGDYVLTDRIFGSTAGDIRLMDNGSSITTGNPATFTLTETKTLIVRLYTYNTAALNTTIKPMLCTAAAYARSTAYQPTALSNSTLTAGLIETLNRNAKNLLWYNLDSLKVINTTVSWNGNEYTGSNWKIVVNADGSLTATVSSTLTTDVYFRLTSNLSSMLKDGYTYVLSGCQANGSTSTYLLYSGSVGVWDDTGSSKEKMYSNSITSIYVKLCNGLTARTLTFKPMICTKAAWDISAEYVPCSLPNPILTPALVEQVDSGAKNVFEFRSLDDLKALNSTGTWNNNAYTISGVTFTVDTTNKTIATSGTSTAMISFVFDAYSTATTKYAGYILSGCPTGGNYDTGYYVYTTDASSNTKDKDLGKGCIIGSTAISRIRIGCRSGVNMSSKTFKPMICTLADWNVSHKFVPYRPNWDLVYSSLRCDAKYAKVPVSTSYSLIGSIKTKGNRVCRITVTQEYTAVAPTGLILSKSNQSSDFNTLTNRLAPPVETTTDDTTLTISALCYYTYDRVVYIWAKAKTASTNGNNFMALCEHFGDIDGVKNSMT